MAIRYFCVVSKHPTGALPGEPPQLGEDLVVAVETPRFCLLTDSERPAVRLPDRRSAIVGYLFSTGAQQARLAELDEPTTRSVLDTSGKSLLKTHWGGYVTFLENPKGGIVVMRDPSGAMPCYYMDLPDHVVLASDVEIFYDAGYLVPHIDNRYLLHHLVSYDLRTPNTGLTGVTELLAGSCLTIREDRLEVSDAWTPWAHVTINNDSSDHLAEHLFETVQSIVRAWGTVFRHPLLGVSGGLDSSIVAAALASRQSHMTCYTMATDDAEGDERAFARILTKALSMPLVEKFYQMDEVDVSRSTAAHLPRPLLHAFGQSDYKTKQSIASQTGADAFFTGIGGDNVFCSLTSTLPVLDRLKYQGPGLGAWSTLNDVCRIAGCSVWQAIDNLIRQSHREPYRYKWRRDTTFLPEDVANAYVEYKHPWLDAPLDSLPGKTLHIAMLARIQGTIDGYERRHTPPLINPLLSQPIVEACLAIPTWKWLEGGRNRSIARLAYSKMLPSEIIDRRSKGGPSRFANAVVDRHRSHLADRLDGGYLARHGLIDVKAVLDQLRSERPLRDMDFDRFATLAEIEAWVAHWTTRSPRRHSQSGAFRSGAPRNPRQRAY